MLTRQGWMVGGVAFALLVTGRLLGQIELYLLSGTLLVLVALSVAYVRLLGVRITVHRELHPARVHAGSPSRVDLRVTNEGGRRTPVLGLRDAVSGTHGAHLLVGPLRPGGDVRAAYRLPTERRGIIEIGPLEVTIGDPFGFATHALRASGVSELTVYPHVDQIVPVPQTTGNDPMAGAEHPNALGRSGEDFYALRHYVVGDDLRRVHWPSTARHDELMVRQDELPWQGRATVLVDVRATTTPPAALELVVSAAASVVAACAQRQDLIRLVCTDGMDSGFAAGHGHVDALMEHLASVRATPDEAFAAVLDRLARASTGGALVVLAAGLRPEDRERLTRLRGRFGSVTVVQFERSAWDPSVPPGPPTVSRDGALLIGGSHPFPDVWNATMRPVRSYRRATSRPVSIVQPEPEDDRWGRRARSRP